MEYKTEYDRDAKSHDWDFTLSATRETLAGGDILPPAIHGMTAHRLFHQSKFGLKAVGKHIVQSLRRGIP